MLPLLKGSRLTAPEHVERGRRWCEQETCKQCVTVCSSVVSAAVTGSHHHWCELCKSSRLAKGGRAHFAFFCCKQLRACNTHFLPLQCLLNAHMFSVWSHMLEFTVRQRRRSSHLILRARSKCKLLECGWYVITRVHPIMTQRPRPEPQLPAGEGVLLWTLWTPLVWTGNCWDIWMCCIKQMRIWHSVHRTWFLSEPDNRSRTELIL